MAGFIGVLFGWFAQKIEGPWFRWDLFHVPGPSTFPKGCLCSGNPKLEVGSLVLEEGKKTKQHLNLQTTAVLFVLSIPKAHG